MGVRCWNLLVIATSTVPHSTTMPHVGYNSTDGLLNRISSGTVVTEINRNSSETVAVEADRSNRGTVAVGANSSSNGTVVVEVLGVGVEATDNLTVTGGEVTLPAPLHRVRPILSRRDHPTHIPGNSSSSLRLDHRNSLSLHDRPSSSNSSNSSSRHINPHTVRQILPPLPLLPPPPSVVFCLLPEPTAMPVVLTHTTTTLLVTVIPAATATTTTSITTMGDRNSSLCHSCSHRNRSNNHSSHRPSSISHIMPLPPPLRLLLDLLHLPPLVFTV